MSGRWLRWAGLGIALGTVILAVVLASRFGGDPALVDSPLIGQPAPEFDLTTLDGSDQVALEDLRGDIVVINFFASWCLQCRAEHADLVATSNAFGEDEADPGSRTAIAYGVFGIPETFFIDPGGVVVGKIIGESDAFTLGATIDAIKRGERPGQSVTGDTQQAPDR
jgi:cytochrome c biogenesis protein CcmG/thiol:disulfide interchange protein DsbE